MSIYLLSYEKYSRVSNRRRGRNKREGWQISAIIINGEGAINGEVGINQETDQNTAIRNFIEIKSSSDLVKISTNAKVVYLREDHLFFCSILLFTLRRASL